MSKAEGIVMRAVGYHWQKFLRGDINSGELMLVIQAIDNGFWWLSQEIHTPERQLISECIDDFGFLFSVANSTGACK